MPVLNERPIPHLPEPLRGADVGTFAEHTVVRRMPAIARRVPEENALDDEQERRIRALIEEIPEAPVRTLGDRDAPDLDLWNSEIAAQDGRNWREVSWFFAETYFYRRIVEAVGFFEDGPRGGTDPFLYQKRRGLEVSRSQIHAACLEISEAVRTGWTATVFERLLKAELWGNQADLSLWPADDQNHPSHSADESDAHLLVDDAGATASYLDRLGPDARVDVLADNAGFELVGDLVMADYLLSSGRAQCVVFHLKLHPTFVSDAMEKDVSDTVDFFTASDSAPTRACGGRLISFLDRGTLALRTHPFWTSPRSAWQMPDDIRDDLSKSALLISKGDANYRRLLGDLKWPLETPFEEILSYFPAPLVVLRTYKSELGCGLHPGQVDRLDASDPEWRTNGRWGIIQAAHLDR